MRRLRDYCTLVWAANFWPAEIRTAFRRAIIEYGWSIRPSGGRSWRLSFWDVPGLYGLSFEARDGNHCVVIEE